MTRVSFWLVGGEREGELGVTLLWNPQFTLTVEDTK